MNTSSTALAVFAEVLKVTKHTGLSDAITPDNLRALLVGFSSMAWIMVTQSTVLGLL